MKHVSYKNRAIVSNSFSCFRIITTYKIFFSKKLLNKKLFHILSNSSPGFLDVFQFFLILFWQLFSRVLVSDHFQGIIKNYSSKKRSYLNQWMNNCEQFCLDIEIT